MGGAPHPSFKGKALGTRLRLTPSLPGYCGAFARLVIPVGGAFANLALPGGRAFANPGANPELLTRTRFPIEIYTTQRILLEKKKTDWLICQGWEKTEEFCKGMFSTFCMHFFFAYHARIRLRTRLGSYRRESTFFGYWIKFLLILFEEHTFIFARAGISPRRRNPEEAL